ncbi:acetolactate synthase small subunit [Desulfovibrio sp. UCD-KL4C]|uniref:acetolactate synthase small subunit n=1 Tax=Desulfovibrio sp. UCD-KL4C TaxID=2578120 RepID=UPI0025BB9D67|nr:acetolactate synthase small subunit [Desulfovibrio sp. UCD-KL4C]
MCKYGLDLLVRNHAGVMSQITGLFARRNFNLEGIVCGPVGTGEESRMVLTVKDDSKLEQIVLQLEKLYDVLKVKRVEDHQFTKILEQL